MSEPVLELPQISLGRYLDLLKRRRWQVLPVSLLGLVIGGTVAFFIPRYYVAETRLEYYRKPNEVYVGQDEDPFRLVVDNIQIMLPQAAGATMQKLGWPEALDPDLQARRDFERGTEERIGFNDLNRGEARRAYAQIVVSYRDRDGVRAAEFLNGVVAMWMQQRLTEMQQQAQAQNERASQHMRDSLEEFDAINRDASHLAQQHGFDPAMSEYAQGEQLRARTEQLQARIQKRDAAEREVAGLEQRLEGLQQQIDTTIRTIDPAAATDRFPPGSPEAKAFLELEALQKALEGMGEAYPYRHAAEARIKELEAKLEKAMAGGGEAVNPAIAALRKQIFDTRVALAEAKAARDRLDEEAKVETEKDQRRAQAWQEYRAKLRALAEAEAKRKAASEEQAAALRSQEQLESAPPIRQLGTAPVPKRPTEPNIFLVAVLGCVVGLGVAVGLILLVDLLRGTLKTVDEVERGLPVPVLGGVSHLETTEQRRRASRSRRRASLLAGVFLVGAVVVLTTYYVAPHRLPPFARDLLAMVLGG